MLISISSFAVKFLKLSSDISYQIRFAAILAG